MNNSNVGNYLLSMNIINFMREEGILKMSDIDMAEQYLQEKNSIIKLSIFRSSDLIRNQLRTLYVCSKVVKR